MIYMAHIYKITNIKNNKIYVGFTINEIEVRLRNHIRASRQNKSRHTYLHSAIRKYGEIYFVIEELEFGEDKKLLKEREKFWIEKLKKVLIVQVACVTASGACHSGCW